MGWGGKETGREWRINMIQTSTPHIIIPRDSYKVRPQLIIDNVSIYNNTEGAWSGVGRGNGEVLQLTCFCWLGSTVP